MLLQLAPASQLLAGDNTIKEIESDVDHYRKCEIHGFIVYVNSAMDALGQRQHTEIINNLAQNIDLSMSVIPAKKQAEVRKTVIWVDWDIPSKFQKSVHNPTGGAAAFYSSRNTSIPRTYGAKRVGITISAECCLHGEAAEYMSKWYKHWLLHEFAHAYHDSSRGLDDSHVIAVYNAAMDKRLFQGKYAGNDVCEYFAELSVIYLTKVPTYPFDRADLKKYDERGFRLMAEMWGGDLERRDAANLLPMFRGHCCLK